jgi:hypothetical protein
MADPARHMALEPQPDERLDELVDTKQYGDPRQRDELAALADMADGIDADRADQQPAAEVGLRREAHAIYDLSSTALTASQRITACKRAAV